MLSRSKKPSRIRRGSTGKTTNVSLIDISTRSSHPPRYPAVRPTRTAITREIIAVITPRKSELRTAKVNHQKRSCPRESVPKMCSSDGGVSIATTKDLPGSYGETVDRRTMITTTARKMKAIRKRPSYLRRSRITLNIVDNLLVTHTWVEQRVD